MKYYIKQRFADGTEIVMESAFASVRLAAEYAVSEGDYLFYAFQLFVIHEDDKGFVRAAQDCTSEFIAQCLAEWQDKGGQPIQIIAGIVEENYFEESGEWYPIDQIDELGIEMDNRLTLGDVI